MAEMMESIATGPYRDYLHNVLNEVLHGFHVDLSAEFGLSYDQILKLLDEFDAADAQYCLSADQAALLIHASDLCMTEFEPDEFHTRLGFWQEDAHEAVQQLEQIAGCEVRKVPSPAREFTRGCGSSFLPKSGKAYI